MTNSVFFVTEKTFDGVFTEPYIYKQRQPLFILASRFCYLYCIIFPMRRKYSFQRAKKNIFLQCVQRKSSLPFLIAGRRSNARRYFPGYRGRRLLEAKVESCALLPYALYPYTYGLAWEQHNYTPAFPSNTV